jgi:hypothetical protein
MLGCIRLLAFASLVLAGPATVRGEENVAGAARNFGRAVRDAGKAVGQGFKEAGRQSKGPAKQVGHGFRDGAIAVGHGFRDGFGKGARSGGVGKADSGKRSSSAKAKRRGAATQYQPPASTADTSQR